MSTTWQPGLSVGSSLSVISCGVRKCGASVERIAAPLIFAGAADSLAGSYRRGWPVRFVGAANSEGGAFSEGASVSVAGMFLAGAAVIKGGTDSVGASIFGGGVFIVVGVIFEGGSIFVGAVVEVCSSFERRSACALTSFANLLLNSHLRRRIFDVVRRDHLLLGHLHHLVGEGADLQD